uniref:Dipeptidyl peptidase 3 n=1 Tax=Lygus hesperus TaxID=30085 RepID=A0A0A9YSQ5_LYGHE
MIKQNVIAATSVNVGIHELLGHGTGKLLMQRDDGSFNFDHGTLLDPFTKKPVTSYYKPGETFGGVFGQLGSSYEECRAEAVSLYLCVQPELLSIFDITDHTKQQHVIHTL